ncbi:thioesterase [Flavobacterium sp. ZT3R18]|uniref:thioesterase II family protein n=1 Tax=Flavobacterium sp. ZT3R18 TaxID=2594429 RepID=UPI00117A248A|nr:thioesterase domain-containing protein [Flavobacterium sp. ZT3R18]TRX32541.1 thioesterase [Flavobacterium sp. ZT3R18]
MNNYNNVKVIAFPFAGGSMYSFQNFLKSNSNFVVIEYPGRGNRINESLIDDITLLVNNLMPEIIREIELCKDYIIYGHSMGGLIGYLVCHELKKIGIKSPLKLVISGRNPPSIERDRKISHLSNDEFWEEVIKIGGISEEVQSYPELMEFYMPILKADFKTIENYIYEEAEKIDLPIDVFYGTCEEIKDEEIIQWKNQSLSEVTIKAMEGDHFFIYSNEMFFINYFKNINSHILKSNA